MKSYDEYIIDEECEAIDETLVNEGLFDLLKKKDDGSSAKATSPIAKEYRSIKENLAELGNNLTKGNYKEAVRFITSIVYASKDLQDNLEKLIKGQEAVKRAQAGEQEKVKIAKSNERMNQHTDEDTEDFKENGLFSVKTKKSLFNY